VKDGTGNDSDGVEFEFGGYGNKVKMGLSCEKFMTWKAVSRATRLIAPTTEDSYRRETNSS